MKKINPFVIILVLSVVAAGSLVGVFFLNREGGAPTSSAPSATKQAVVSPTPAPPSVVVGKTTQADLTARLGTPLSTKTDGGFTIFSYPTTNKNWNNDYYLSNGIVAFVRERVFPLTKDAYNQRVAAIGVVPSVLFGPDARSGILLYSFPERGVSFLANRTSGYVYEAWSHPQAALSELLSLPQFQGYSTKQSFGPEGLPQE